MSKEIELDVQDGIGLLTFNRPEAMNTFTAGMMEGLGEAYRQCDADDAVRVMVVTGAGKAFCAGADMSGGGETFDAQQDMGFSSCPLSFQAWDVRKPVIAACNGHAVGVGLGIATQCDMRIVAEQGKYGFLQTRRGVVADFAVEHVLPRLIGFERAFEMIVRGVRLNGSEAYEWGLAGRVADADQVLPMALEIAGDMAVNCSPLVMGMHKRLLWRGQDSSRAALVELETKALHYTMGRPDAIEGGMAYFERRPPNWSSSLSADWPEWL